jgi:hypothetical protein
MSSGGQTAPTPYQPPNQAGAASAYQQGAGQLATAGSNLYNSVAPQLAQVSQAVANNPYYTQALQGAQQAASTATNTVAPMQLAGASADQGLAGIAANAGQAANAQATGLIPAGTSGMQYAPGVLGQAESYIPGTTDPLITGGNSVMQTGFDPQNALYNRSLEQLLNQQNAINASQGLQGPIAAGVTGQQAENFNIDWQNQELQRQLSALAGAGGAYTGAAGNLATLQNTGVGNFNSLINSGVSNAANLISTGSNALQSGVSNAVGANTAASDLGTAALNTEAGAAQLPQDIYLQQQQADLAAIAAQVAGTNASTANTQQAVADQGQYLNIGQTAAQGAINAAQANNQNANTQAAGFGQLFGDVAGMFVFG